MSSQFPCQSETDEEEPFWRGVFALPSSTEILFTQKIEIKIDELPSWEPHIEIDDCAESVKNND